MNLYLFSARNYLLPLNLHYEQNKLMKSADSASNLKKYYSGVQNTQNVENILHDLKKRKLIQSFQNNQNFPYKNYEYESQFLINFVIKTIDEKFILIRTSNSFRLDRTKTHFYDFLGVQLFSEFSGEIVASILLLPDQVSQKTDFINTREKFNHNQFYSPATHWLTYSEFINYIDNYASQTQTALIADKETYKDKEAIQNINSHYKKSFNQMLIDDSKNLGSFYGKSGFQFERYIVDILNDEENLLLYKKNIKNCYEFEIIVDKIISNIKLNKNNILFIKSTDTIVKLKNLGSPKTDIHIKVYTSPSDYYTANLSIKNTISSQVSCHDYKAQDFCEVIAPDDTRFCEIVYLFQRFGSWTKLKKHRGNNKRTIEEDRQTLQKYMTKLIEWAITGKHDQKNIVDADTQIANYLLTRNPKNNACRIDTADEYCKKLISKMNSNALGSPFSWTYPSKQRGKRIQLKMPVLS